MEDLLIQTISDIKKKVEEFKVNSQEIYNTCNTNMLEIQTISKHDMNDITKTLYKILENMQSIKLSVFEYALNVNRYLELKIDKFDYEETLHRKLLVENMSVLNVITKEINLINESESITKFISYCEFSNDISCVSNEIHKELINEYCKCGKKEVMRNLYANFDFLRYIVTLLNKILLVTKDIPLVSYVKHHNLIEENGMYS